MHLRHSSDHERWGANDLGKGLDRGFFRNQRHLNPTPKPHGASLAERGRRTCRKTCKALNDLDH